MKCSGQGGDEDEKEEELMRKPSNDGHRVRLILALVSLMSGLALSAYSGSLHLSGPVTIPLMMNPSWTFTGNLNTGRGDHTVTLLSDGHVLVAGGYASIGPVLTNSAELYDPDTGTWSATGNLNTARYFHTATLLPNGKVLVAGGFKSGFNGNFLNSAELYDPDTGTWSTTGNLNTGRTAHTATLLANGKVLVAGGYNGFFPLGSTALNSAELYDPDTGTWSTTGNLNTGRTAHTATLLANGKVLVAGGFDVAVGGYDGFDDLNSAELYDPDTGTWSSSGNLNTGRTAHTATLLANGKVLVAGGGDGLSALNSAELFDVGLP